MSAEVLVVVLMGALLHAVWNTVVKSGRDPFLDTVLIVAGAGALAGAALVVLPAPARASWPFAAASAVLQVVYYALIAAAYRAGDMSQVYPLMRGTAPLLVAAVGAVLLAEPLPPAAWAGILLVCGGVLVLALERVQAAWPRAATRKPRRNRDQSVSASAETSLAHGRRPAGTGASPVRLALANAVVIAAYTLVDGAGVRRSGAPAAYTAWVFLLSAPPLLAWAAVRRPRALAAYARARGALGLLGGACTVGSYGLALWAMTAAPVAMVAALRETSILFGLALAALVLGERFGPSRWLAAASITAGVVAFRLT